MLSEVLEVVLGFVGVGLEDCEVWVSLDVVVLVEVFESTTIEGTIDEGLF